jgi:hypothetical protein
VVIWTVSNDNQAFYECRLLSAVSLAGEAPFRRYISQHVRWNSPAGRSATTFHVAQSLAAVLRWFLCHPARGILHDNTARGIYAHTELQHRGRA